MPFERTYDIFEVKGMLQLYEGNRAIRQIIDPQDDGPRKFIRADADQAAHAVARHGGADFFYQINRVNTPGEARKTATYWSKHDQAAATTELLNSVKGQAELRKIDNGTQNFASFEAALRPGVYMMSEAEDRSNIGQGIAGHLVKNAPGRADAGAHVRTKIATKGFVKVIKGVGGLLQIQTSYPMA